jgi:hypothetical protein
MSDALQDAIARKLAEFAEQLVQLYREALHDAVAQVVGGEALASGVTPRAIVLPGLGSRRRRSATKAMPGRRTRRRRSADQIQALASKIEKYVAAHPGAGAETIKAALAIPKSEWNLPVNKLLAEKKLRTTGEKRATKYFPSR